MIAKKYDKFQKYLLLFFLNLYAKITKHTLICKYLKLFLLFSVQKILLSSHKKVNFTSFNPKCTFTFYNEGKLVSQNKNEIFLRWIADSICLE